MAQDPATPVSPPAAEDEALAKWLCSVLAPTLRILPELPRRSAVTTAPPAMRAVLVILATLIATPTPTDVPPAAVADSPLPVAPLFMLFSVTREMLPALAVAEAPLKIASALEF